MVQNLSSATRNVVKASTERDMTYAARKSSLRKLAHAIMRFLAEKL